VRSFIFRAIMTSFKKITCNVCFLTQILQFSKEKKLTLIRLFAKTLLLLGLTFFNSMLALLVI
jgi:hypothetical protein